MVLGINIIELNVNRLINELPDGGNKLIDFFFSTLLCRSKNDNILKSFCHNSGQVALIA